MTVEQLISDVTRELHHRAVAEQSHVRRERICKQTHVNPMICVVKPAPNTRGQSTASLKIEDFAPDV